jgi:hypothetical protein
MFISFDNGSNWQPLQLNLPNVPVTDIKVHQGDLVVSTQGRSFWILDDISPLHQLTRAMSTTAVHLYKPRDGFRTKVAPHLLGPAVNYYLPGPSNGAVKIEILDVSGRIVNTYSSDAPARNRGTAAGTGAVSGDQDAEAPASGRARGTVVIPHVTTNSGLNRFVWDVRHENGLTVPPGAYEVRVRVGAVTLAERFNVLIDPRVAAGGITVADLREQFDHNVRVKALLGRVNQLIAQVRDARAKLTQGSRGDAERARRLEAIESKLLTEPVRYGKPGLQAQVTYLASMTAIVDQKIGRDAVERSHALEKELQALETAFTRVEYGDNRRF